MGANKAGYITAEGRQRLETEVRDLWARRTVTTAALAAAAAEGDRSENAEYIYRKKELREIDRRLGYLQRRLPALHVVQTVQSRDRAWFGAWVTLENEGGSTHRHRIVGPDEFDHEPGYISVDGPLARALLGRTTGDAVDVTAAGVTTRWLIVDILYPEAS